MMINYEGHEDKANQKNINYFNNLRVLCGEHAVLDVTEELKNKNEEP